MLQRNSLKVKIKMFRRLVKRACELGGLDFKDKDILAISFVGPRTIARVNEDFVNHQGITDVISFDYRDEEDIADGGDEVSGELIICIDKAFIEAKSRKNSTVVDELILYVVHGILHIAGENDLIQKERARMRRRERELLSVLNKEFDFHEIIELRSKEIAK